MKTLKQFLGEVVVKLKPRSKKAVNDNGHEDEDGLGHITYHGFHNGSPVYHDAHKQVYFSGPHQHKTLDGLKSKLEG